MQQAGRQTDTDKQARPYCGQLGWLHNKYGNNISEMTMHKTLKTDILY